MNTFDDILSAYDRQVQLPWASDTPPAGRIWIVWYGKALQRRFTGRLGEFEQATIKAGHGWHSVNLSPWFGEWIARHEFFDALVEQPRELRGLLPEIEDEIAGTLKHALKQCTANDVLAVDGCGSLFGVAKRWKCFMSCSFFVVSFPPGHSGSVFEFARHRVFCGDIAGFYRAL